MIIPVAIGIVAIVAVIIFLALHVQQPTFEVHGFVDNCHPVPTGTQVIVKDSGGTVVATGVISGDSIECLKPFEVTIPIGLDRYGVVVGDSNPVYFSEDEMRSLPVVKAT